MNDSDTTPADQRAIALADIYVALRLAGHSYIGTLKTLRVLGLSLAEAKAIADACDARRVAIQQQAMLEHFESAVAH